MKKGVKIAAVGLSSIFLSGLAVAQEENIKEFMKYEVLNGQYVKEEIPVDPNAYLWKTVRGKKVFLYPQISVRLNDKQANRLIPKKKLVEAMVKVAYNNDSIAVYVRWKDNTPSIQTVYDTNKFADGVSIEFPNSFGKGITLPYVGMGDGNHPVTVYLQKVVEGRDYQKVFVSEGFGSLTEIKEPAQIEMKYNEKTKEWTAVFKRPLKTENSNLKAGLVPVAFAIWDGSKFERDGNKSLSRWKFIKLGKYKIDEEYLKYVSWGYPADKIGDPAKGKKIALQNGCAACHRFDDQLTAPQGMAPDLSDIGGIANPVYLKESVVNPNDVVIRNLNPNRHYNKHAKPDKFKAYPNNDMYQWYIEVNGKKQSKMPPFSHLSEQDLKDLIAYLSTLRNWKNFK
ncbi:complex iron-sulfur molybdoenzyme family reductase subunit gamma [Persephonella hydrogeniphila]|uniref:Complex iron-sulfur molybdoenzyme family reductase subunit gamma n=1 Tax=Persephonella hydrogeniphila TaxID=198703 RepID=A0A285NHS5_9AQUI|nr:ethylbenzene dehydrogenase-related protein [Persephonella hydrogeniphila]SNZ08995.1 complex iron-sulfur molybdoenzyme family reductase subunit gamma [Persephonella hydrogeniphila]